MEARRLGLRRATPSQYSAAGTLYTVTATAIADEYGKTAGLGDGDD